MKENNTSYQLKNILLLKCQFQREVTIPFKNVESLFDIGLDWQLKGNEIVVLLRLDFKQTEKEKTSVHCLIETIGVFERIGDSSILDEEFANVNAAAIIYPYIREQLTNVATKSGIGAILAPPVNFVQLYKEKLGAK